MASRQFCTFHLDGLYLGVEVRQVQEVLRYQRLTRAPLAPPVVRGLINLRGQIVTALDLRQRLGLPPALGGKPPMNVVVRTQDATVSLLVDDIGDVAHVDEALFERPPETLKGACRALVRGAYKLQGRLLLELDTDEVLSCAAPA
ncbi:MAG: chemotaxis protein CheW [Gemmataceae bacterium]|nr:chemotaxis protein CheW [Gemmataceae bacterium]